MASITFKNVNKTFDKNVTVIPDLNLEIKDQEFIILVGPSGCGKSTTLRMIAGLEDVSDGELYIGDRIVNNVAPKDRNIAMVFQSYALYPHMNVYKNMAFSLSLKKLPKKEIDEKVRHVAKILDIEKYLDRKPKALSGGQRQRVALGRAMVREPEVFLLDEPLSNLDAKLRTQMRAEITRLHKELQTTFVYVTHDQTEAMTMADRIVVMKDGVIQQTDTPQNLYKHPCNMFVAGFIGTPGINFLKGTVGKKDGRLILKFGKYEIPFPTRMQKGELGEYIGKEVVCGLRPEDFTVQNEDGESFKIEAYCEMQEMMGSEIYIYAKFEDVDIISRVSSDSQIETDKNIGMFIKVSNAHVFDAESKKLICD